TTPATSFPTSVRFSLVGLTANATASAAKTTLPAFAATPNAATAPPSVTANGATAANATFSTMAAPLLMVLAAVSTSFAVGGPEFCSTRPIAADFGCLPSGSMRRIGLLKAYEYLFQLCGLCG